jgi:sucrose-6-phosphate hydrolase SacC (GH32 family)
VRELRLERQPGGWYSLLSTPVPALAGYVAATTTFPDRSVSGSFVLPWKGRAYELELDISWDAATNVRVSVGRSADGLRHTNIGKYGGELYVDRAPSDQAAYSLVPYTRAAAPIDVNARSVHLRIFVDMQSVKVFVNAGHTVLSQLVHFDDGDTGISFYTDGGPANFTGITVRDFGGVSWPLWDPNPGLSLPPIARGRGTDDRAERLPADRRRKRLMQRRGRKTLLPHAGRHPRLWTSQRFQKAFTL